MGSMMYGERAGTGYTPLSGSLENSPDDRAYVSAFHVGALCAYWCSLLDLPQPRVAVALTLRVKAAVLEEQQINLFRHALVPEAVEV